jgi:23S rRNA (guanosine2251-2'-O)-methyltransferase
MVGNIPVHETTSRELRYRAKGGSHQGVLARISSFPWDDLGDLEGEGPLLLLDGIQDPHNLGAIIRSSVAFGVRGVILEKRRVASLSPVVAKAACGALEYVSLCRVPNLPGAIRSLKKRGYWVVGTREGEGIPVWKTDFPEETAVVIGAEGSGMRPIVAKACDLWVSIPTSGAIQTLNASVAVGVMLYELTRFRKKKVDKKHEYL